MRRPAVLFATLTLTILFPANTTTRRTSEMTASQFRAMTAQQKSDYRMACATRENAGALMEVSAFEDYLDKPVKVVSGRKVPIGTTGVVFWVGMRNYSKYGNWWSWEVRLGLRTEGGEMYFTSERNIERLR